MNDGFDEEWIKNRLAGLIEWKGDYQKVIAIPYDPDTDRHEIEITKDGRVYRLFIIGERFVK